MEQTNMQPKKTKAHILIADEHPIVHYGLSQLINRQPDMRVCATVSGMTAVLHFIQTHKVDLVIAGVSLADGSGIELIKHIRARFNELHILVLSSYDEAIFAERVLSAGAHGYLMKTEPVDKILEGIRRVRDGNIYVSEPIVNKLLGNSPRSLHGKNLLVIQPLSDRELDVYNLIGRGKSSRDIATILHINLKTIETHCAHIKKKLKLKGMVELIHHAADWFHHTKRRK